MSFLVSVAVLAAMFTAALLFALLLVRWLAYSEPDDAPDETPERSNVVVLRAAHEDGGPSVDVVIDGHTATFTPDRAGRWHLRDDRREYPRDVEGDPTPSMPDPGIPAERGKPIGGAR